MIYRFTVTGGGRTMMVWDEDGRPFDIHTVIALRQRCKRALEAAAELDP